MDEELMKIEKDLKEKHGECECCDSMVQYHLKTVGEQPEYKVCGNCLLFLVTNGLNPRQFKKLLEKGHSISEFMLHDDYYDPDTGEAEQPTIGVCPW